VLRWLAACLLTTEARFSALAICYASNPVYVYACQSLGLLMPNTLHNFGTRA